MSYHAKVTRRGSGWGYRCTCGEAPNQSTRQRRTAERWARLHQVEHEAAAAAELKQQQAAAAVVRTPAQDAKLDGMSTTAAHTNGRASKQRDVLSAKSRRTLSQLNAKLAKQREAVLATEAALQQAVREARLTDGASVRELAELLGIGSSTVQDWTRAAATA